MSVTAVSLPAACVLAVQFNAGKEAYCGQTLALSLDNDGSPIEKRGDNVSKSEEKLCACVFGERGK